MRAPHHLREQLDKHRRRPQRVGIRQRRAPHRLRTEVIKPRLMAPQTGLDLAQAARAGKLPIEQRHQLALRRKPPHPGVRIVPLHRLIEDRPGDVLQNFVKNAILVPHGVDPILVSRNVWRRPEPSRINAMQPVYNNLNRTAV